MASRDSERPERSCSRVVLDANCVRGSPVEELVAIRARGFSLHASIEGVREVWAKSLRERAYDGLASRLARLGPLLDPQEPIAFAGTALLSLIGTIDARVSEKAARFRRDVVGGWWSVVGGGLNENAWQGIGAELQSELDAEQRGWMALVEEAKGIERKLKPQASEGITVDERGVC